jgi:hypothetical protein
MSAVFSCTNRAIFRFFRHRFQPPETMAKVKTEKLSVDRGKRG